LSQALLQKTLHTIKEEGFAAACRKALRRGRRLLDIGRMSVQLRRRRRACGISRSLDLVYGMVAGEIQIAPAQIRSEIESLLRILEARKPAVIVEIGTARGGTLFLFSRVAAPDALLISVDLPGGDFGGGYALTMLPILRALPLPTQTLKLVRADSHQPETCARVKELLGSRPIDLLFIDGDHRFEGVKDDFETYATFVRHGGLVAIHDIVPGPAELVGGVPDFWASIRRAYSTQELVESWDQGGYGLGLVRIPDDGLAGVTSIGHTPTPNRPSDPEACA
jgi:predicted O-methyltransferase YrrM